MMTVWGRLFEVGKFLPVFLLVQDLCAFNQYFSVW